MKRLLVSLFIVILALVALSSCAFITNLHTCEGEEMVALEPTCAEEGEMFIVCKTCLNLIDRYTIPATGEHSYTEKIYAEGDFENCDDRPYTRHCTTCGYTDAGKGGLEAHTFVTETVAPNCSSNGYDKNTCTVCGKVHIDNYTTTSAHTFNGEYQYDGVYHWKNCTYCNESGAKSAHNGSGICLICGAEIQGTPGITYQTSSDGTYAIVTGYTGSSTIVNISDEYFGVPVTHIGPRAFERNYYVKEIVLSENITHIGESAFSGSDIKAITNIDNVKHIGSEAFSYCSDLTLTELPKGIEYIGDNAFRYCEKITVSVLPESLCFLGKEAFCSCFAITDLTIKGNNLTTISSYAFDNCARLNRVVIGEGVITVGYSAFGHSGVKEVVLSDSVAEIHEHAFYYCENLESIHFGKSLKAINGTEAFYNTTSLLNITLSAENENYCLLDGVLYTENLDTLVLYPHGDSRSEFIIPNGVVSIPSRVFAFSKFKSVTIPGSVRTIGYDAFYECSTLYEVIIEDGMTTIGERAFNSCENLTSIRLPNTLITIEDFAFWDCNVDTLIIPDSVEVIGFNAFRDCYNLSTLVLGSGVKKIEGSAFPYSSGGFIIENVFYNGTPEEWKKISISSSNESMADITRVYFYSETKPEGEGRYWHYDEMGTPTKW